MQSVLSYIGSWVLRVALTLLALVFTHGIFSNWRIFLSFDFEHVFGNVGPLVIYSLMAGIFHLIPSAFLAVPLRKRLRKSGYVITDVIYAVSLFAIPLLLSLLPPSKGFSFGVSEGEIIADGVRTELGWFYLKMNALRDMMIAGAYLCFIFAARMIAMRLRKAVATS